MMSALSPLRGVGSVQKQILQVESCASVIVNKWQDNPKRRGRHSCLVPKPTKAKRRQMTATVPCGVDHPLSMGSGAVTIKIVSRLRERNVPVIDYDRIYIWRGNCSHKAATLPSRATLNCTQVKGTLSGRATRHARNV